MFAENSSSVFLVWFVVLVPYVVSVPYSNLTVFVSPPSSCRYPLSVALVSSTPVLVLVVTIGTSTVVIK